MGRGSHRRARRDRPHRPGRPDARGGDGDGLPGRRPDVRLFLCQPQRGGGVRVWGKLHQCGGWGGRRGWGWGWGWGCWGNGGGGGRVERALKQKTFESGRGSRRVACLPFLHPRASALPFVVGGGNLCFLHARLRDTHARVHTLRPWNKARPHARPRRPGDAQRERNTKMRRPAAPLPMAPPPAPAPPPAHDGGFMDDDFPEIDDFGALDALISQRKVKRGDDGGSRANAVFSIGARDKMPAPPAPHASPNLFTVLPGRRSQRGRGPALVHGRPGSECGRDDRARACAAAAATDCVQWRPRRPPAAAPAAPPLLAQRGGGGVRAWWRRRPRAGRLRKP